MMDRTAEIERLHRRVSALEVELKRVRGAIEDRNRHPEWELGEAVWLVDVARVIAAAQAEARREALEEAATVVADVHIVRVHGGGECISRFEALKRVRALAARDGERGPRCGCTHEAGDSDCAVHPTCSGCGAPVAVRGSACPQCRGEGG